MTNPDLARDYFTRAKKRAKALAVLFEEGAFADVVRESQEIAELVLKAVLRHFGLPVPFSHEPSAALLENQHRLPEELQRSIPPCVEIARRATVAGSSGAEHGTERDGEVGEVRASEDAGRVEVVADAVAVRAVPEDRDEARVAVDDPVLRDAEALVEIGRAHV